jgi:hypothetical protein
MKEIEVDMNKKVDVSTGEVPKEGESHGRIDSAEGCYKYFKKRFKKFAIERNDNES